MATLASLPRPFVQPAGEVGDAGLAATLARAFLTDPVTSWLIPDDVARLEAMARFFLTDLQHHRQRGEVWVATDPRNGGSVPLGGALWAAPGRWKVPTADVLQAAPALLHCFGRSIPKALRFFTHVESHHPSEPHWYLSVLGTDPLVQGRGVGSALVEPLLTRCDKQGTPAYLESSREQNVPFYRRFGFEVLDELRIGGGAPPLWRMWRKPR